jgi:hypothetical protein
MNKFNFLTFCILISISLQAQKVTVSKSPERIKGSSLDGYSTELEGKKEDVSSAWMKFLKDIGKAKQSIGTITITEPKFGELIFSKGIIYATAKDKGNTSTVWIGINPSEWEASNVDRINHELEKVVTRFGVKFYRDKIQVDIDQAQQALDAVTKQQQRLTNVGKELVISLGNNEQDKIALDKSLEANKFENAVLKVKIDNNKKAIDSLAQSSGQIEKVRQMHMDRQRKVN